MSLDGDKIVEFAEIGHSGGKITFSLSTKPDGRRSYQIGYERCRLGPVKMVAVYALPQGVPVAEIQLGGIGQPWNPPPVPGCFPVFLASDSEGEFGHNCPSCGQYWRSGPWPNVCPYCSVLAEGHDFLSKAQRRFVREYCERLRTALDSEPDGDVVIDLDAVADAAGKEGDKPAFYMSEVSQQHKFTCGACGGFNDILGRFGYCSSCGTRNDLAIFKDTIVPGIRERINSGTPPEDCVRDAVASFDTFLGQYGKALAEHVPMTEQRKVRLTRQRYHNASEVAEIFSNWFDINLRSGIKDDDWAFVVRMFLRRHVYEHNGGEVDQKYLDDSGDTTVTLKQHIRETKEAAHRLLGALLRMAGNAHEGFHCLFPPIPEPIRKFDDEKARLAKLGQ
jgi:hypothetical protein